MTAPLTAQHDETVVLRSTIKRLFAENCTEADVRRTMDSVDGYDRGLWQQLAEIGITGIIVGEAHGGAGLGPQQLGQVMEEAGAAHYGGPLFSSSVMSAGLLNSFASDDARARLLPGIAQGRTIASVALTGSRGTWGPDGVDVTAGPGGSLTGSASYVTFGNVADVFIVVARTGDGCGLFEVERSARGLGVTANKTLDLTLRLCTLDFDAVAARQIGGGSWSEFDSALDMARVALASEQAGAASRIFDMTVEYIKNRFQFGRAVGGFQALKHMAADLLIERESAISAARYATEALAENRNDASEAVNLAAFACKDAFSRIAFDAVQMHGGIAFTWEFPVHLYLRRARSTSQLLGSPAFYRERYLQILEAKS